MYRSIAVGLLLGMGLVLGGCASAPASGTGAVKDDYCSRVDCAHMAAVNSVATQNGVNVVWVHPPER